jgi:hypothetical protein
MKDFGLPGANIEFVPYSQSVSVMRTPETLYRKRPWVPLWLWNMVSNPDPLTAIEESLAKAQLREYVRLLDSVK